MNDVRLPWNGKEGFLYGLIITVISCMVSLILNIGTSFGNLGLETWKVIFIMLGPATAIAFALETFVAGPIAHRLVNHFLEPTDGFNARIVFNIIFVVLFMSAGMTLIGHFLAGEFVEAFLVWPKYWPRNFAIVFWNEILLAQPIARCVMKSMHKKRLAAQSKDDMEV